MRNRFFVRLLAFVLLVTQFFTLLPAIPLTADAAQTEAATTKPLPFALSNATMPAEEISMSGIKYSGAVQFVMGYNGLSNGAIGEVTYNFKGKYSSLTFSAGYVRGEARNAALTVIADGVVVKDKVEIKHTDVAKKYTISLSGVSQLIIRFESSGYDKTYYAIANVSATPKSGAKEDETRVSDEFYDIPRYLMEGTSRKDQAFEMGGYTYEGGYVMDMGYGWTYDDTASLGFNFQEKYKKITFDIARFMNRANECYTRSAYLTIKADGVVVSGYDKKELKWNDLSTQVTVNLNGVTQLEIHVTSNGYDKVCWAIGNIQLVSDGHAHGILLDMDKATLTKDAPTVDLNPRVYPSDAKNRKFTIESDCPPLVDVDEEGLATGYYKGNVVITATSDEGEFTAQCKITSQLPQFMLENVYKLRYVEDTIDFTKNSAEYVTIVGGGDGSLAGDLARAYVDAGRVITDGYGGAINGLDKVLDLKIDVANDFDFLMADLLSGLMAAELYEGIINEEMLEAMSNVLLHLGNMSSVATQFAVAEAVTDFGELPDVMSTEVQAKWHQMKTVLSSEVTYDAAGKMFTALGSMVDLSDAIAAGCDNVGKLMEYYVLCNALANANNAYAAALKDAAAKMEGKNLLMSPALKAAVDQVAKTMQDTTTGDMTAFYLACGTEVAKFALRSGQILADTVAGLTDDVTTLGAIRTGIKTGTSLANWFTSTDDRYTYGKMLHMAGFLAEGMHAVVLERQAAFEKDDSYKNAEAFSAAVELYLNLQILACDYGIAYFNSYATSALGQFKLFSDDEIAMANILLIYKVQLMQLRDSGQRIFFGKDGSISGFVTACPVTVVVTTKDGQEIARMETGKLTVADGYDWAYRLLGSEHEHKAGFYDPELHNITIIAEGDGTMSLVEYTGTADGITSGSTYLSVPVQKGESYALSEQSLVRNGKETVKHDEMYPESAVKNPFVDITEDMFCYDAVLWAYYEGITTGKDATHFNPSGNCTRSQVVTFLWRAAGQPEPKSMENPFPDVGAGKYYTKAVLWAVEQGITNGFKDGTFGPNETCTRAQIVTFLWRYMGKPEPKSMENPFPDVNTGAYYGKAVLWAVENGITTGYKDGTFGPNKTCKRDQIVTFLYRCLVEK